MIFQINYISYYKYKHYSNFYNFNLANFSKCLSTLSIFYSKCIFQFKSKYLVNLKFVKISKNFRICLKIAIIFNKVFKNWLNF